MKNVLDNFDYRVGCDDFFLYELGRLIDEELASFEEEEFRTVIDAGIHEHIERHLEIRSETVGGSDESFSSRWPRICERSRWYFSSRSMFSASRCISSRS